MCVDKIKNLVGKVKTKFPNSSIGVSSLTYREDINVDVIRVEVNDQLKRLAHDNNFQFIDNSVIDRTCLNNSIGRSLSHENVQFRRPHRGAKIF